MFKTETVPSLIDTPTTINLFEPEPVVWLQLNDVTAPLETTELLLSKTILGPESLQAL